MNIKGTTTSSRDLAMDIIVHSFMTTVLARCFYRHGV